MLGSLVFLVLLVVLATVAPIWPHSRRWGCAPGAIALVALLVVAFLSMNGWL